MPEIPKRWHYIWLGSSLPEEYKANILGWIKHNPDYEFNMYIDSATLPLTPKAELEIDPDIPSNAIPNMQKFCDENNIKLHDVAEIPQCAEFVAQPFYNDWVTGEDKVYAFAADILRLCILWVFGGVYTDVDCKSVKSLGQLCNDTGIFIPAVERSYNGIKQCRLYDNWFIAVMPRDRRILECLKLHYDIYCQTIICGHELKGYTDPFHFVASEKPRRELFFEPVIFSDCIKGANRKMEEAINIKSYNSLRKICPHNTAFKLRFFGFGIFVRFMRDKIVEDFGSEGIKQSAFLHNEILSHYEAQSWAKNRYAEKIDKEKFPKLNEKLAKLREGV